MPVKKSLFSKPAWAAKAAPTTNHDQPIFGQNVYEDIIEAKRKAEEKRIAKQKEKEERKAQETERQSVNTQLEDGQVVKKRRISTEPVRLDNDDDDDEEDASQEHEEDNSDSQDSGHESELRTGHDKANHETDRNVQSDEDFGVQGTSRKKRQDLDRLKSKSPVKSSKKSTIVLDDNDDDDDDDELVITGSQPTNSKHVLPPTRKTKPKPPPVIESDPESEEEDEYIRELKRKARAEAREKRAHTTLGKSKQQGVPEDEQPSENSSEQVHSNETLQSADTGTPQPEVDLQDPSDARVQILISTIIPNCTSVIIERFASQPLDKVFTYWKKRNEANKPELMKEVFFTWNGQKLYPSTTTRALLEQIKRRHGTKIDGSDLAEGKIEIEAVIQKIYDYRLDQKKRFQAEADSEYSKDAVENGNDNGDDVEVAPKPKPGIIIHLNSKDKDVLPFLNLRVRPDTTVQRIITGYKKKVGLDLSRQVYLVFDGERLQPEANVEQIGFEDEDAVDVME